MNTGGEGW